MVLSGQIQTQELEMDGLKNNQAIETASGRGGRRRSF